MSIVCNSRAIWLVGTGSKNLPMSAEEKLFRILWAYNKPRVPIVQTYCKVVGSSHWIKITFIFK